VQNYIYSGNEENFLGKGNLSGQVVLVKHNVLKNDEVYVQNLQQ